MINKILSRYRYLKVKQNLIDNIIQFLILITTYVVLDFLSLIAYAIAANKLIIWIKANPKVINTISACVLIIIAIIIAFMQSY